MKEFLEWLPPWFGGEAAMAFGLGRPDLCWLFAALALAALIGRAVFRDRGRVR